LGGLADLWAKVIAFLREWGPQLPYLLEGARSTLILTTLAVGLGIVFGTVIGLCRVIPSEPIRRNEGIVRVLRALILRFVRWAAGAYVDFFRGTPLLVQLYIVFFGLPMLFGSLSFDAFTAGVIALSLNSGAYVGEIVRAGIQSIDRGQMEAALATGLTYVQAMWHVVLPQAMRRMVPPLGNEFIALLKDSSLVAVISLEELFRRSQILVTRTFKPFEVYLMTAVIYLVMTKAISLLVNWIERRSSARRRTSKRVETTTQTASA